MRDIHAIDRDTALVSRYQADDHVETGGFTRTVGAKQTHDLTRLHFYVYATHNFFFTVGFVQVRGFEHISYRPCRNRA